MDMDSMSGMDMGPSSTITSIMNMVTATASAMDMSATMDMPPPSSSSSSSSNPTNMSMNMVMAFHTSYTDLLFATGWTPTSKGKYAGACIFLIVLAVIYRFTHVIKHRSERYLSARVRQTLGDVSSANVASASMDSNSLEKSAFTATALPDRPFQFRTVRPWRVSVDIPLALLQVVLSGVSYLLMLAVMSFNVGYFLSVLGGIFLGELLLGRFAASFEAH
ncbi:Ctr copper transporter family-domain-containing protein [Lipomyces arxii]|uniref:Ctr copper transporter family-domain-containing protein n=1 Tax=Lipomyces arxii TaxID=56418 RepID=UPI0034CD732A